MKNTISIRYADSYIRDNYGRPKQDLRALVKAIRKAGNEYNLNKVKLFHLLIENEPMEGTHSYGFHTAYGRELINLIQSNYYDNL